MIPFHRKNAKRIERRDHLGGDRKCDDDDHDNRKVNRQQGSRRLFLYIESSDWEMMMCHFR